ncbi:hypothetical protein COBT_000792, partial [Conglomerata obtusa]
MDCIYEPEVYNNYFGLEITVINNVKKFSSNIELVIIVTACFDDSREYYQKYTEILTNELVISVTKYKNIIDDLINRVKSKLKLKTKESLINERETCEMRIFTQLYFNAEIFDIIFDDTIHADDINSVLIDCNLDFKIFGHSRPLL